MILVTGDRGYIGSNFIRMSKEPCIGWDRSADYDLSEMNSTSLIVTGANTIVHLAADINLGESIVEPMKYWQNNLARTIDLIALADELPQIQSFIFASSAAARGDTPYGLSKRYAEHILRTTDLNYAVLRLENVVGGANQHGNFIKKCFDYAVGNDAGGYLSLYSAPGRHSSFCKRDFIHVFDVCRAIIAAVDYTRNHGPIHCEIGLGEPTETLEVLRIVEDVTGKTIRWTSKAHRQGDIDTSFAEMGNDLDWTPQYNTIQKVVRQIGREYER